MWSRKEREAAASARHILVDTEALCAELKCRIEAGTDFAEVAGEHSGCPSHSRGGNPGEFRQGQMVREFDQVVFSAALHKEHGPVKTRFGYHLIEITERRAV